MDIIDYANDRVEEELQRTINAVRADIPPGVEGECDFCGEHSLRLINGACAPCRDRRGL